VLIGITLAVVLVSAGAVILGPQLRTALNGLNPLDPIAFAAAIAVLTAVIGVAAYLPARRALRLTPLAALRQD
jgi:ABC-type antimicrobial peptide transport system permease subunit